MRYNVVKSFKAILLLLVFDINAIAAVDSYGRQVRYAGAAYHYLVPQIYRGLVFGWTNDVYDMSLQSSTNLVDWVSIGNYEDGCKTNEKAFFFQMTNNYQFFRLALYDDGILPTPDYARVFFSGESVIVTWQRVPFCGVKIPIHGYYVLASTNGGEFSIIRDTMSAGNTVYQEYRSNVVSGSYRYAICSYHTNGAISWTSAPTASIDINLNNSLKFMEAAKKKILQKKFSQ